MSLLGSSIVDLGDLWKILAISVIAGTGVVGAFGFVLLGISRYQSVRGAGVRVGAAVLVTLAGSFCLAAVVLGLFAMIHK